jgi:hypothetical protein
MSKVINMVKRGKKYVMATAATGLVATGVQAADHTTLIGTASTEGGANVVAVIAAVIGIAILGFGVSAMISWFKR